VWGRGPPRALGEGTRDEHGASRGCGKRLDEQGHCILSFGSDGNVQWRGEHVTSREYGGEIALALTQQLMPQLTSALRQK
jgi:hypothetical protein